jgi:hypothetical protein
MYMTIGGISEPFVVIYTEQFQVAGILKVIITFIYFLFTIISPTYCTLNINDRNFGRKM